MRREGKRSRGLALVNPPEPRTAAQTGEELAKQQQSPDIPPHVWDLLQEAGEEAARALLDILRSPKFRAAKVSEQRALIDLALTRAYGLPVRRSLSVNLESSDADAIAASIIGLHDALPERQQDARPAPRRHEDGPLEPDDD